VEENLQRGLFRAAAGALFAGVLALLFAVSDPAQAASVLFAVPIALLALSDGIRGGTAGALVATGLVAVWVHADDVSLNAIGWSSRIISFLVIGLLVGHYQDLARAYERRRLDERYASELHDRVVQSLVLARYQLRDNDDPSAAVDTALANAKEIISERLGDVHPGDLRLSRR
jgi:signal transduction histidine kinase